MSRDYLTNLTRMYSIARIATRLRAQCCVVAPMLLDTYPREEAASAIKKYEYDAQSIERCATLKQAREILRKEGYIS